MTVITGEQFAAQLAGARSSLFRVEACPNPELGEEAEDFARFLAGNPTPPDEMPWYRPWVEQVRKWTDQGIALTRVRILAEPPTGYQRWLLWGAPWFSELGERIWYINRSMAEHVGLPLEDWWLIDDERVIVMRFTPDGEVSGYELITNPDQAEIYRLYRGLALDNSTTETIPV
jgi:hypothetical protein